MLNCDQNIRTSEELTAGSHTDYVPNELHGSLPRPTKVLHTRVKYRSIKATKAAYLFVAVATGNQGMTVAYTCIPLLGYSLLLRACYDTCYNARSGLCPPMVRH
jgi:hypothetical protein